VRFVEVEKKEAINHSVVYTPCSKEASWNIALLNNLIFAQTLKNYLQFYKN
jgi:hypothetical protein